MKNKINSFLACAVLCIASCTTSFSQTSTGELRGKIMDKLSGEPIPGAVVSFEQNGRLDGVQSDSLGEYKIKPIGTGTYTVKFSFIGYNAHEIANVRVSDGEQVRLNAELSFNNELPIVEMIDYKIPLMPINPNTPFIIAGDDIKHAVSPNVNYITSLAPRTFQSDNGEPISLAGSRYSSTKFYVDGMPVAGEPNVPGCAIDQVSVYSGSMPACYGDATGGVVIITTKGFKFR